MPRYMFATDTCSYIMKRSNDAVLNEVALNAFLRYVEVLDFPDEASLHYAKIRADLKTLGTMIGANDLFIAAHARSLGLDAGDEQYARVRTSP
jgi:tRNA(fMet)-specific endonuclease VapC